MLLLATGACPCFGEPEGPDMPFKQGLLPLTGETLHKGFAAPF